MRIGRTILWDESRPTPDRLRRARLTRVWGDALKALVALAGVGALDEIAHLATGGVISAMLH